jgi:hypothetical protein
MVRDVSVFQRRRRRRSRNETWQVKRACRYVSLSEKSVSTDRWTRRGLERGGGNDPENWATLLALTQYNASTTRLN